MNLTLEGYPNIFVGGDIKNIKEEKLAKVGTADGFLITRNIINSELKKPLIERGKGGSLPIQKEASSFVSLGPKKGVIMLRNTFMGACFPPSKNQTWFMDFIYNMKINFTKATLKVLSGEKESFFPVYGTTPNPKVLNKLKD